MVVINFHGIGPVTRPMDEGERDCWLEDLNQVGAILDLAVGREDVVLTVDDGNESDESLLLPMLKARGLLCTFFLCSNRIGLDTFLSESQVGKIVSAGMRIGVHGMDHVNWRGLANEALKREVVSSKSALESVVARKLNEAACPFGGYDRRTLNLLRETGYKKVYTSDTGRSSEGDWLVARNTVRRSTSAEDLKRLIERGDPFLRSVKLLLKRMYKRVR